MGGRFFSLDQLYKKFRGNNVFPSPKLNENQKQKKAFAENWSHFFPKSGEDQKERSSPQFVTIFGKKFVWSFSPGWLFFLWFSSAQLSVGGRQNFDGGTLTLDEGTRPPASPLQFKYCPHPLASGGWGLCPLTLSLRRLGASLPDPNDLRRLGGPPPDPQNSPPTANFWLRALLLYAKIIKEAETEKTKLVCHIFIISSISIGEEGRGGLPGPPGYVYALHALSILKAYDRVRRDKTLEGLARVWRWWSVVTCYYVILLRTGGLCSDEWQVIKAVRFGRWTPARVRFATTHFHCLHELDRQLQPSWWVCHDWKLPN